MVKTECVPPTIKNKARMSTPSTTMQYSTESSSLFSNTTKREKSRRMERKK